MLLHEELDLRLGQAFGRTTTEIPPDSVMTTMFISSPRVHAFRHPRGDQRLGHERLGVCLRRGRGCSVVVSCGWAKVLRRRLLRGRGCSVVERVEKRHVNAWHCSPDLWVGILRHGKTDMKAAS